MLQEYVFITDKVILRAGSPSWKRLSSRRSKIAEIEQVTQHDGFVTVDLLYEDAVRVRFIPTTDVVSHGEK